MIRRIALVVLLQLAAGIGAVIGHAVLVASDPADGATFIKAPAEVTLQFNEHVTVTAMQLADTAGTRWPIAVAPAASGDAIRIALPPDLPTGHYVLNVRVTSADAHPVAGVLRFGVGDVPIPRATSEPVATPAAVPRIAARIILDLATLLLIGGALYVLLVGPFPRARPILPITGGILAAASIAALGLHGDVITSMRVGFPDGEAWRAGFASVRGQETMLAVFGAVLVAGGTGVHRQSMQRALLVAGVLVLAGNHVGSGHVATISPRVLATLTLLVHVLGAAFWFAALVAFTMTLADTPHARSVASLHRFSRVAIISVPALMFTGVLLTMIELERPGDLIDTDYGRLILAKCALVATLVMLAGINRWHLMPRLGPDTTHGFVALVRNIRCELAFIVVAIAVAGMLSHTPPPRTGATASVTGFVTHDGYQLTLAIAPARAGLNTVELHLTRRDGSPVNPTAVTIEFASSAEGIDAVPRDALPAATGRYRWTGHDLAPAGDWEVVVRARMNDFEEVTFRTRLRLPSDHGAGPATWQPASVQ